MQQLPTFSAIRRQAEQHVSDAQDWLRSDWADDAGPTEEQTQALRRAQRALAEAKQALHEAAS